MGRPRTSRDIEKPCEQCGTSVRRPEWKMRAAQHIFCSQKCYSSSGYRAELSRQRNFRQNPEARMSAPCEHCGKDVERYVSSRGKQIFCSRDCHNEYRRARQTKQLTGGGYMRVFVGRDYPGAAASGHILEHRKVMQDILGRPLLEPENVHHINGVRDDNRPENLELWSRSQPHGQRVVDKVRWAREFLALYESEGNAMGTFRNVNTGVVIHVDDSKDDRYGDGQWESGSSGSDEKKPPAKKSTAKK